MGEIIERPIGRGVSVEGGNIRRFSEERATPSGNTFLFVGVQIGVGGLFLFTAIVVQAWRSGVRRSHAAGDTWTHETDDPVARSAVARLVIVAGVVGGLTHVLWQNVAAGPLTWVIIALGTTASIPAPQATERGERLPTTSALTDR